MARIHSFDAADFRRNAAQAVESEAVRGAIFELLRFTHENADRIGGGQAKGGSFHYEIDVRSDTKTLFTCDASGYGSVSLGNFVGWDVVLPGRLIIQLRSTLAQIPGFDSFSKKYRHRPGFEMARTVVDPSVMGGFQKAVLRFQRDAKAF